MSVKSQTDWARIDALTDEDIDTSEIPEQTEEFFQHATLCWPRDSGTVLVHLDASTLEWYRAQEDSERRVSAALRLYADAHRQ